MGLLKKTQNTIKHVSTICFAMGLITACSKYDARGLNMFRSKDGTRANSYIKHTSVLGCNDCRSLYKTARNDHKASVETRLCDVMTNVNTCCKNTALVIAAEYNYETYIKALIGAGANVNARDQYYNTALILAARNGHEPCVNLLIEKQANVDACGSGEYTALMCAAKHGHGPCVKALIGARANVYICDNNGNTALMWAEQAERAETNQNRICTNMLINANCFRPPERPKRKIIY